MMADLILAIDQGTTSTRAMLFGADGKVLDSEQRELPLITPQSGWVEQDAAIIWRDVVDVVSACIARAGAGRIAAIGITNQRETIVAWDAENGRPLYNAIVWQDRRGAPLCEKLKNREEAVQEKTGLLLDPYFSATKISWLMDNVPDIAAAATAGRLRLGTIDAYLLWRMTGGRVFSTDATNASRTMLYDVRRGQWDEELCALFNVPVTALPQVMDSNAHFADVDAAVFGAALPVRAVLGDQQAALFGQACFSPGMVKSTYGTGCFALMNAGEKFTLSKNRLLTTIAWRIDGKVTYAAEGAIFVAGAAIQFLRDTLSLIGTAAQSEALAETVPDAGGVVFVPALTGLGAPHWNPRARGGILGLSRGTTAAHIVRAALEAQAYQTRDLIDAFTADTGMTLKVLRVDGGLARNALVCRMIATMLGIPVERPANTETTAWGAAALAGIGAGLLTRDDVVAVAARGATRFESQDNLKLDYSRWTGAVGAIDQFA